MTKRIIQLAKEAALSGFADLVRSIVANSDDLIAHAAAAQQSFHDRTAMAAARDFLRREGSAFSGRIETFYRDYLERAMRTMYTDLRAELHTLSADHLSLIDDETMNRQIEVDRLVQRLRDVERENLGRLNLMIAQLHGEHDVRERENPFRPYLLARALHDTLNDMVKDVATREALFECLGQGMIARLPEYYRLIRDVFESGGVHAQLIARPSMLSPAQREMLARQAMQAWQGMPMVPMMPGGMLPGLQNAALAGQSLEQGFPDLVRRLFNRPKWAGKSRQENVAGKEPAEPPAEREASATLTMADPLSKAVSANTAASSSAVSSPPVRVSEDLISRLTRLQQEEASSSADSSGAEEENRLFSLREQLETEQIGSQEQVIIEVMALLFEFILRDKLLPGALREKIVRLQIPLLKAAMLEPEMLQQSAHPARQLIDRIGSLAASVEADSPESRKLGAEIDRISERILCDFDRDMKIFSGCLSELDRFAAHRLVDINTEKQENILQEAIDEAEQLSVMMAYLSKALGEALQPLQPDARVTEFVLQTWTRVLAYAAVQQMAEGATLPAPFRVAQLDLIPGLIWSAQPRHGAHERTALMRFLPGLVAGIKKNLQSIPMSEAEYQHALDQLVGVHTEVLRPSSPGGMNSSHSMLELDELTQRFSTMKIDPSAMAAWPSGEAPVGRGIVAAELGQRKINAELIIEYDRAPLIASDRENLMKLRPGARLECALRNHTGQANLIAVGAMRTMYVLQLREPGAPLLVYSSHALAKALRNGSLRSFELAPLFERAVESLMTEVESS